MRTVGLVGCVKNKLPHRTVATELYISPLFRLSRRYAEHRCDEWAVLSAKHGLVLPTTEIDPYEDTLNGKPRAHVLAWGRATWKQISTRWDPDGTTFVLLAGKNYASALSEAPHVERPLGTLQIGQRLSFLKRAVAQLGK